MRIRLPNDAPSEVDGGSQRPRPELHIHPKDLHTASPVTCHKHLKFIAKVFLCVCVCVDLGFGERYAASMQRTCLSRRQSGSPFGFRAKIQRCTGVSRGHLARYENGRTPLQPSRPLCDELPHPQPRVQGRPRSQRAAVGAESEGSHCLMLEPAISCTVRPADLKLSAHESTFTSAFPDRMRSGNLICWRRRGSN